jgi:molybdate transport system substrate-binding protein
MHPLMNFVFRWICALNTAISRGALGVAVLVGAAAVPGAAVAQPVVVAASDLKFALDELAARFTRDTGQALRLVYGSSGNLASQIAQGAPFELFLSADEALVLRLADSGHTLDRGQRYALGRIGLLVPARSPLTADGELRDLAAALRDGRLQRLAIANPEHAPYGQRAREALDYAGLWSGLQGRLVLGENVSQAAQFALSGSVQAGIVAQSLALSPAVAGSGAQFAVIPSAWHQPLVQRMVLLKGASAGAKNFYAFLASSASRVVFERYGFSMPTP